MNERSIRASIKNRGHDFNGEWIGQGILGIWARNRNGAYGAGIRIVGGACATVEIAGRYIQGSSDSPLSGAYVMRSDNLLKCEAVHVDGKPITATPENSNDLYGHSLELTLPP